MNSSHETNLTMFEEEPNWWKSQNALADEPSPEPAIFTFPIQTNLIIRFISGVNFQNCDEKKNAVDFNY